MRRTSGFRLWWISATLLAISAVCLGILLVEGKLGWAWNALELHFDGTTTTPPERSLEIAARALLQRGGDGAEIRELLEEAIAIDPNSTAVYYLGDVCEREGDLDEAIRHFEAFLAKDRTFLPVYMRLAELYERTGRAADRERLLHDGIAFFESNVDAFEPHTDPDVAPVFNDKARATHNAYREALAILRRMQSEGGAPGT